MSASMLDEIQGPPEKRMFVCPCCVLSFNELDVFIRHCERVKASIDAAIVKSKIPLKVNKNG